jgi:hypothetical protein
MHRRNAGGRARKTQVKNDLSQIVTAVNAYYTEYGKYPDGRYQAGIRHPLDTLYGDANGSNGSEDVFNVLRAVASWVNVLNPRKIIFFNTNLPKNPSSLRKRGGDPRHDRHRRSPNQDRCACRSLGRYLFGIYRWKL